jgi:hypothetical protein
MSTEYDLAFRKGVTLEVLGATLAHELNHSEKMKGSK